MSCNPSIPEEQTALLAVILCGGKSTRMGNDKGLIVTDRKTWVEVTAEKLEEIGVPFCVSVNLVQKEGYLKLFAPELIIEDNMNLFGPLEGLMSVHNQFPETDLLVVACDLPDLSISTLTKLVSIYGEKSGEHDFIVYSKDGEPEPLVGVYTAEGLQKIFSLILTRQMEKFSMKHILEIGNTFCIQIQENQKEEFKNYNLPSDLKAGDST